MKHTSIPLLVVLSILSLPNYALANLTCPTLTKGNVHPDSDRPGHYYGAFTQHYNNADLKWRGFFMVVGQQSSSEVTNVLPPSPSIPDDALKCYMV